MVIVNAIIKKEDGVLTIKRKKDPWRGMYGLPGGHVEKNESNVKALRREVREETGFEIEVKELDFKGSCKLNYFSKGFEVYFYFVKIVSGKEKIQSEEVEEIKWLDLGDFFDNLREHGLSKKEVDSIKKIVS